MYKQNKRNFNKIGQYEVHKVLNELEEYVDIYITDHESSLYIKFFIEEQRVKHNLKEGESK